MTTTKIAASRSKKKLLMLAGVCGILTPIVAWSLQALAIYYSPGHFDLTQNLLGDLTGLGYASFLNVSRPLVSSPTTEVLFRSAHLISGPLAIVFSIGLFYDDGAPSHRLGAVLGVLGSGALGAIGLFTGPTGVMMMLVAMFASLLLISTAALLIGGAVIDASHKWSGGLSIVLGIVALAGTSFISYLRGSAEVIAFLTISVWAIVFGVRMLWRASHQM